MTKVNLTEMIKRLPAKEQAAIREKSAKITAARKHAREQQDNMTKDGDVKSPSAAPKPLKFGTFRQYSHFC